MKSTPDRLLLNYTGEKIEGINNSKIFNLVLFSYVVLVHFTWYTQPLIHRLFIDMEKISPIVQNSCEHLYNLVQEL